MRTTSLYKACELLISSYSATDTTANCVFVLAYKPTAVRIALTHHKDFYLLKSDYGTLLKMIKHTINFEKFGMGNGDELGEADGLYLTANTVIVLQAFVTSEYRKQAIDKLITELV
jgi:hypothetical protein